MTLEILEIPIKSEICLTPGNCYPVKTYLPSWITLVLIGSVILIAKNFIVNK